MKVGVVVFPGTNCDRDTFSACEEFGWKVEYIWHNDIRLQLKLGLKQKSRLGFPAQQQKAKKDLNEIEHKNYLDKFDVIFLPGGFSYGDYIRSGALAKFSPVITAIKEFVDKKQGFVVGICNGFQILCECGLLPGALTHNECLKFICKDVELVLKEGKREKEKRNFAFNDSTITTSPLAGEVCFQYEQRLANIRKQGEGYSNQSTHSFLTLPIAHAEGRYIADKETIKQLKKDDMIFLTYKDNPNGSVENIAGLYDKKRKIIGMMPHPERAFFKETGLLDGKIIFEFIENKLKKAKK